MHKIIVNPSNSLRIFTEKLIDYAGLFPPASLELAQAFNNYVYHRQADYSWILSKFIIPVKKLPELGKLLKQEKFTSGIRIPLSLIITTGDDRDGLLYSVDNDLKIIVEFIHEHNKNVSIDCAEVKLPFDLTSNGSVKDISEIPEIISGAFRRITGYNIQLFFETVYKENFEAPVIKTAEAISLTRKNDQLTGFKLRTGGTEPAAFPTTLQIATAIETCLEYNVPMKCTAGLHHPIRHYNEEVSSNMHGFLNVFGAGIFAYAADLDEDSILEILNEEEPYSFHFSEEGISWNDLFVTNDEISEARKNFMISYGSCSFDEPIADMKTMELL